MEVYANGLAHAGQLVSSPQRVDLADEVNRHHRLFCENAQASRESRETAIAHAVKCGQLLMERKTQLRHGAFQAWVDTRCEFKTSTARLYMKAAQQNANGVSVSSLRHVFQSGRPEARREKRAAKKTAATPTTNSLLGAVEDDDKKNRERLREFARLWAARRGWAAIADELTAVAHWLVGEQPTTDTGRVIDSAVASATGPQRFVRFRNGERCVYGIAAAEAVNGEVRICVEYKRSLRMETFTRAEVRKLKLTDQPGSVADACRRFLDPWYRVTKEARAFLERSLAELGVGP